MVLYPLLALRGQHECPKGWSSCTKLRASFYAGCSLTHWTLAHAGFFPSSLLLPHRKAMHLHSTVNKVGCHLTRPDCWQYPQWGEQPSKHRGTEGCPPSSSPMPISGSYIMQHNWAQLAVWVWLNLLPRNSRPQRTSSSLSFYCVLPCCVGSTRQLASSSCG